MARGSAFPRREKTGRTCPTSCARGGGSAGFPRCPRPQPVWLLCLDLRGQVTPAGRSGRDWSVVTRVSSELGRRGHSDWRLRSRESRGQAGRLCLCRLGPSMTPSRSSARAMSLGCLGPGPFCLQGLEFSGCDEAQPWSLVFPLPCLWKKVPCTGQGPGPITTPTSSECRSVSFPHPTSRAPRSVCLSPGSAVPAASPPVSALAVGISCSSPAGPPGAPEPRGCPVAGSSVSSDTEAWLVFGVRPVDCGSVCEAWFFSPFS